MCGGSILSIQLVSRASDAVVYLTAQEMFQHQPFAELAAGLCLSSFFFSSRRRHTRCLSDWSSDVCSSDLRARVRRQHHRGRLRPLKPPSPAQRSKPRTRLARAPAACISSAKSAPARIRRTRSEERRVGKSVDLGDRRSINKKKKKT